MVLVMPARGTKLAHAGRGLGYKPDGRHKLGLPYPDAAPKLAALPAAGSLGTMDIDAAVGEVVNQGGAPFCFANAPLQAIRALQVLNGASPVPELGSRLWVVYFAHALEHDVESFDGGIISDAFEAIQKLGLPPEHIWPYSDDPNGPYKTKPSAEAYREAFDAIAPFHATRILTEGGRRIDDIRKALAARLPIVFGTQVTEDFCENKLGPDFTVDVPQDQPLAGGHALMGSGDDPANARVRVPNSWGPNWGDNGRCWFTYAYMEWVLTEDIWVVDFTGRRA